MSDNLASFFALPLFWRASAVVVMISLCAALLGVTLVLRRLSFMGDGLSHVAFGAIAVSGAIGLAGGGMMLALPVTTIVAVMLLKGSSRTRGDATLAILSVGAMSLGYLTMNLFPASSNISGDVCTTLFGSSSLLTLTVHETLLCAGLSAAVIAFQILTYHKSFDIAFDEDFARASGVNASRFNLASAIVSAIVIVVSMRLVGALLVSALLVFPAVAAMRLTKSFKSVTIVAALFAAFSATIGLSIAVAAGTPVGATIVAVDAVALLFSRSRKCLAAACAALTIAAAAALLWPGNIHGRNHFCYFKDRPSIVTTINPIYDWTREIVREHTNDIHIALLQKGMVDLHSFELTADDINEIIFADRFVHVGGVSDSWVERALRTYNGSGNVAVALMDALPKRGGEEMDCACHGDHAEVGHHHTHAHHHHHAHAEDEHIWLSLRDAVNCVSNIADAVSALNSANAQDYSRNAAIYTARLAALDAEFAETMRSVPSPVIVADRFPFARMMADYGVEAVAAFRGCSADAEASFSAVRRLADEIVEHDIKAICAIKGSSHDLARAVIEASGREDIAIVELDSLEAPSPRGYLERMQDNLNAFKIISQNKGAL